MSVLRGTLLLLLAPWHPFPPSLQASNTVYVSKQKRKTKNKEMFLKRLAASKEAALKARGAVKKRKASTAGGLKAQNRGSAFKDLSSLLDSLNDIAGGEGLVEKVRSRRAALANHV